MIQARSFPVCNSNGRMIRTIGIAEDITEQRRVLDEIQGAREQAELLDAILQVLGTTSPPTTPPLLVTRYSLRESKRGL